MQQIIGNTGFWNGFQPPAFQPFPIRLGQEDEPAPPPEPPDQIETEIWPFEPWAQTDVHTRPFSDIDQFPDDEPWTLLMSYAEVQGFLKAWGEFAEKRPDCVEPGAVQIVETLKSWAAVNGPGSTYRKETFAGTLRPIRRFAVCIHEEAPAEEEEGKAPPAEDTILGVSTGTALAIGGVGVIGTIALIVALS